MIRNSLSTFILRARNPLCILPHESPIPVSSFLSHGRTPAHSGQAGMKQGLEFLIQIRFSDTKYPKICSRLSNNSPQLATRRFEFDKRSQFFIGTYNETLPVAVMCVFNPDRDSERSRRFQR